jgi:hypothetical protein
MSEQEFELYLKLLSRCLGLTPAQREQIADELRDHLEERLEELARAGVPREKAVVQALDEFGDAAVLAGDFAAIARLKRRRFLMRLSLGSVGALAAGLLIAFAFWPENRAVRGPERAMAQAATRPKEAAAAAKAPAASKPLSGAPAAGAPAAGASATGPSVAAADSKPLSDSDRLKALERERDRLKAEVRRLVELQGGRTKIASLRRNIEILETRLKEMTLEADAQQQRQKTPPTDVPLVDDLSTYDKIDRVLDQRIDFTIETQSLKDALDFISARYGIPILTDRKALDDENVDTAAKVHLSAPGLKLRNALTLLLSQLPSPLDFDILDGVLTVTTPSQVDGHNLAVVYDCRDLIHIPSLGTVKFGPDSTTEPASKPEAGQPNASKPAIPLIAALKTATSPGLWEAGEDGARGITEFGGLLMVRHNRHAHEEIRLALSTLRRLRKEGAFAAADGTAVPVAVTRRADEGSKPARNEGQTRTPSAF